MICITWNTKISGKIMWHVKEIKREKKKVGVGINAVV